MNLFSRALSVSAAFCLCLVLFSCGGSSMPKPVPDYSLSATPATITLVPGGAAQQVTIGVSAINGMTGVVTVAITGLPSGVVAQPATLSIAPGTTQNVTVTASATAAVGTATLTVTGISGMLSHTSTRDVDRLRAAAGLHADSIAHVAQRHRRGGCLRGEHHRERS